ARVRLAPTVEIDDAERAIKLFRTSMEQVGMDPETGDMDIDIITTGQSHSQAVQMRNMLEVIKDWCKEHDSINLHELMSEAEAKKIDKTKVQDYVSKLLRAGDVYEPKPLHYKPVFKE
ncbi:MAG: AAA family ATPase, partial [Candidatus ainarchaeum sp.]|nr:AAA family ATPase [Candidatus ainarchaeum sp.]